MKRMQKYKKMGYSTSSIFDNSSNFANFIDFKTFITLQTD